MPPKASIPPKKSQPGPPATRSRTRTGKSSRSSNKSRTSKRKQNRHMQKPSIAFKAPTTSDRSTKTPPPPLKDSTIADSASTQSIPSTINVPVPDVPTSNMSIHSQKSATSRSTRSKYVTIEQFNDLKRNMPTKDDIAMIAKSLAELTMKQNEPYSDTKANRHKYEPDSEDRYGFEEKSFAQQSPEPNSYEYEYEDNFAEADPPHSNQFDVDQRNIPIAISKHNNLFQVITPMVFTPKAKSTTAYKTLSQDMEDMQISDLDYLEETDMMEWTYLNIFIRKKLIIILKYYKRNKYIVRSFTLLLSKNLDGVSTVFFLVSCSICL